MLGGDQIDRALNLGRMDSLGLAHAAALLASIRVGHVVLQALQMLQRVSLRERCAESEALVHCLGEIVRRLERWQGREVICSDHEGLVAEVSGSRFHVDFATA